MGRVKTKTARDIRTSPVPLFLTPLTFTRDSRENENKTRENDRTGFYKFV